MGLIEELRLDPETGAIAYAVLSAQDRKRSNRMVFFALAWDLIQVKPVRHAFVADVDKKMLSKSRKVSQERRGRDAWAGSLLDRSRVQIQTRDRMRSRN